MDVFGTFRTESTARLLPRGINSRLLKVTNLCDNKELQALLESVRPKTVINCIACNQSAPQDPMELISVYSVFPRRLAFFCRNLGVRLIHISTDGVFTGNRGGYSENDLPDASDLYGVSKLLGETVESHVTVLRTSVVGHELQTKSGLLEWFLSQEDECRGYTRVIFSGFPAVVLAEIIRDFVIPDSGLQGIYHVASAPISKFRLLTLVACQYGKRIRIIPDDSSTIDRSLDGRVFTSKTGYSAPAWEKLVEAMHEDKLNWLGA
jgi:dTDP-4-dehydrorhamnose reductase